MPYELWLGWRFLFAKQREQFISLIAALSIGGMALGVAAMPAAATMVTETVGSTAPSEHPLLAVLRPVTDQPQAGAALALEMELRNASFAPVLLYRYAGANCCPPGRIRLLVRQADGTVIPPKIPVKGYTVSAEDYELLGPGQAWIIPVVLEPLAPGRYEITAMFSQQHDPEEAEGAWAGEAACPPLTVEVQE